MKIFIKVFMTTPITKQVSKENTQFLEKKLVVRLDLSGIMLISAPLKYFIINSIFVTSKRRLIRFGMGMLETIHLLEQFVILRSFQCLRSFKLSHIQIWHNMEFKSKVMWANWTCTDGFIYLCVHQWGNWGFPQAFSTFQHMLKTILEAVPQVFFSGCFLKSISLQFITP